MGVSSHILGNPPADKRVGVTISKYSREFSSCPQFRLWIGNGPLEIKEFILGIDNDHVFWCWLNEGAYFGGGVGSIDVEGMDIYGSQCVRGGPHRGSADVFLAVLIHIGGIRKLRYEEWRL